MNKCFQTFVCTFHALYIELVSISSREQLFQNFFMSRVFLIIGGGGGLLWSFCLNVSSAWGSLLSSKIWSRLPLLEKQPNQMFPDKSLLNHQDQYYWTGFLVFLNNWFCLDRTVASIRRTNVSLPLQLLRFVLHHIILKTYDPSLFGCALTRLVL